SIIRVAEEHAMKDNTGQVLVQAPVEIANYLLNEKRSALAEIERRHASPIIIVADEQLHTPHYEVTRVRENEMGEETSRPSYHRGTPRKLPTHALNKSHLNIPDAPAVKNVKPAQPAPIRAPREEDPAPAPVPLAIQSQQAARPKAGFMSRVMQFFAGAPAAAPVAADDGKDERRQSRGGKQDRRGGQRDAQGQRGGNRNESRGERGDRGGKPQQNRQQKDAQTGEQKSQGKQPRRERPAPAPQDNAADANKQAQLAQVVQTDAPNEADGGQEQQSRRRSRNRRGRRNENGDAATAVTTAAEAVPVAEATDAVAQTTETTEATPITPTAPATTEQANAAAEPADDTNATNDADDNSDGDGSRRRRGRRGGRRRRRGAGADVAAESQAEIDALSDGDDGVVLVANGNQPEFDFDTAEPGKPVEAPSPPAAKEAVDAVAVLTKTEAASSPTETAGQGIEPIAQATAAPAAEPSIDEPAPAQQKAVSHSAGLTSSGVMSAGLATPAASRQALPLSAAIAVSLAETTFRPAAKPQADHNAVAQSPVQTDRPQASAADAAVVVTAVETEVTTQASVSADAADAPPALLPAPPAQDPQADAIVQTDALAADAPMQAGEALVAEAVIEDDTGHPVAASEEERRSDQA
ncbi:MAG: ribonuclease E/G, partial [Xanthomonadaceae bacterium]|nr:ribonuclease E/G [Xanthomonadaceae bacterium]